MNKHIEGTNNETIINNKNINISGDLSETVKGANGYKLNVNNSGFTVDTKEI